MVESAEAVPATPKKTKTTKAKKPKVASTHPPVAKMVVDAITSLKDRGGSSLAAIKKYIAATYKVDPEKMSFFIRKYLKSAVASGALVQTKGKGANGSFKLSTGAAKEPKAGKPKRITKITSKKVTKSPKKATKSAKKVVKTPKKAAAAPKKAAKPKKSSAKKAKPAKKAASPKKPKAVKLAVKPKAAKASPKKKPAAKKAKK